MMTVAFCKLGLGGERYGRRFNDMPSQTLLEHILVVPKVETKFRLNYGRWWARKVRMKRKGIRRLVYSVPEASHCRKYASGYRAEGEINSVFIKQQPKCSGREPCNLQRDLQKRHRCGNLINVSDIDSQNDILKHHPSVPLSQLRNHNL